MVRKKSNKKDKKALVADLIYCCMCGKHRMFKFYHACYFVGNLYSLNYDNYNYIDF